ncbi:MAG: phosphoglycerate kinase [Dehalococcoidia bacterium]|nr:phosphoglycerate kinase [Dehalococcoidia bacterium]
MDKQTVRDIDLKGKRALVRVDFNVPLDKATGEVADDNRIRAAMPTISYLRQQGASVVLCSHLGRPDGKVVESLRLTPVAKRLSALLGTPVITTADCVGPEAEAAAQALPAGAVLLLENLRFHPEEESNDPAFAQQLAELADVYVNDAFGTGHRAHASTAGVAAYLPAVAGLLMEREIAFLGGALATPEHPFVAILGGAKVSDKVKVVENLLSKVDTLLIGGGMANAFLVASGKSVGASRVVDGDPQHAAAALKLAQERGVLVLLPTDVVVADSFSAEAAHTTVPIGEVPSTWMLLDIGPETRAHFTEAITGAALVIWNGPMGVFEFSAFAQGTLAVAQALTQCKGTTIVGGGETAQAVQELGVADKITHVSTGGGATLEFLEGRTLPGVAALLDKRNTTA